MLKFSTAPILYYDKGQNGKIYCIPFYYRIDKGAKWENLLKSLDIHRKLPCKVPKCLDARKLCCNHSKTGKKRFYHCVMHPKDEHTCSIANSEDADKTAPLGAV